MIGVRLLAGAAALALLATAEGACALTLDEAVALAVRHDPGLRRAQANRDAAHARLDQARSGLLPSVTVTAQAGSGSTDFGGFFGFGERTMRPQAAGVEVRETVFSGGAVEAGIGQAKAGDAAARARFEAAREALIVDVASAFEAVRTGELAQLLRGRERSELATAADQAALKFKDGEVPRTDVDQANARLAQADADLADSDGALARARARFRTLVGEEAAGLETPNRLPAGPPSLDDAVSAAFASNPGVAAARAALEAAQQGVRKARAEGAPKIAVVAQASSVRDQFLPGYRADGSSVGVEGRWPLFSGGLNSGKIHEAEAERRAAEAAHDQARDEVREAAIDAWQEVKTSAAVADAALAQANAAAAALDSVRNEVRVGEKPTLALLDAEREALAAQVGALRAHAARTVAAYRLQAVLGR